MRQKSKERLDALLKKADNLFGVNLKIDLTYDLKGSCTIGQCRKTPNGYTIRLHEELLYKYGFIYLNDVLNHEFAHAIQMEIYKYKTKPHGKEWKNILSKLENTQYNPKLRPKYEIIKKSKSTYNYKCNCNQIHKLSKTRHNRIQKGTKYICKKCKGFLTEIFASKNTLFISYLSFSFLHHTTA